MKKIRKWKGRRSCGWGKKGRGGTVLPTVGPWKRSWSVAPCVWVWDWDSSLAPPSLRRKWQVSKSIQLSHKSLLPGWRKKLLKATGFSFRNCRNPEATMEDEVSYKRELRMESISLGRFLCPIRRNWRIISAGMLLCPATSLWDMEKENGPAGGHVGLSLCCWSCPSMARVLGRGGVRGTNNKDNKEENLQGQALKSATSEVTPPKNLNTLRPGSWNVGSSCHVTETTATVVSPMSPTFLL